MAYESTTATPVNAEFRSVFKQHEFYNSDSMPRPVWTPPPHKRCIIDDICLDLWEKQSNDAFFSIQLYVNGGWEDVFSIGTTTGGTFISRCHSFQGKLISDGSGPTGDVRVRVRKWAATSSTNWTLKILITGRYS